MRTISKGAMLLAGAHFVALASPSLAYAQEPPASAAPAGGAGSDVIDLKNGGVLRGTLIDAIPNGHARIQLVTGEVATVPWQDIERIERAAQPPAAAPAPAAAAIAVSPAPAAGPAAGKVWMHIEGSQVAELQRDTTGDGNNWETVCTAPCDKAVPAQSGYRIVGEGIRDSAAFEVTGTNGERQTLSVDEGSRSGFVLGIVGTAAGGVALGVGLIVVLVSALARSIDNADGVSSTGAHSSETAGWVISGVGTAGLVGGIVLMVSNGRTRVSQGSATASSAASLPANDWAHIPARSDSARVGALPAAPAIPLYGGTF
jgi:hypothetical protein